MTDIDNPWTTTPPCFSDYIPPECFGEGCRDPHCEGCEFADDCEAEYIAHNAQ